VEAGVTKFCVDRWIDQIKEKPDSFQNLDKRFDVFDSEAEAKAFIRDRAFRGIAKAEKDLLNAVARKRKCEKKFGFKLSDMSL
jgi:hypothetical protein